MATISVTHSTIPRKIPRELVFLSLLCVLGPVCLGMVQWTSLPRYGPVDRFASAWSSGTFVRFGTSLPQYGPVDQFASVWSSGPACFSMVEWTGLLQHGRVDRLISAWSSGPARFSMVDGAGLQQILTVCSDFHLLLYDFSKVYKQKLSQETLARYWQVYFGPNVYQGCFKL